MVVTDDLFKRLLDTCSSFSKIRRTLAYVLRFTRILQNKGLPAFTNTAMDMFGPIQIKINRKTCKEAQIIIFTCMTTRAIHLELVTDRSTDTFLMAFRRFACTRGHHDVCWSDCGTNFVGAQAYLKEITSG
jgi:hypothetical protein